MKRHRVYHGLCVVVEEGVPTPRGEGVRITLPDGSQCTAAPTEDHPNIEAATSYAVNRWRVDRWSEAGKRGAI